MKHDSKQEITIEALLKLKKAEKPQPEFWAAFESELRAKQLAAIVGKRPWWSGLSRVFILSRRHSVSLGALAAVALAVVGIRHAGFAPQAPQAIAVAKERPAAVSAAPATRMKASEPEAVAQVPVATAATAAPAAAPVAVAEASVSHVMQAPQSPPSVAASREPFGDGIRVTLTDFHAAVPGSRARATSSAPTASSSPRSPRPASSIPSPCPAWIRPPSAARGCSRPPFQRMPPPRCSPETG